PTFGRGGCVVAVDFAPLAPSLFAILRTGGRPRLAAYSLPSIGATCGGSRSRYGRPTASSVSCPSTHFHSSSLAANRFRRVSPLTLTSSMASPWPYPPRRRPAWNERAAAGLAAAAIDCR